MASKVHNNYNRLIRFAIALLSFGYLAWHLFVRDPANILYDGFWSLLNPMQLAAGLAVVVAMMAVNWGLEAWKWQLLVSGLEKVTFPRSVLAVLAGVTVGFFMPNRAGEFLGRIFILEKAGRVESALLTLVGSISQLLVTLVAGSLALLLFLASYTSVFLRLDALVITGIITGWACFSTILLLLYFNVGLLGNGKERPHGSGRLAWLRKHLTALQLLHCEELLTVLLISIFRYLVFTGQAFLLLKSCGLAIGAYDAAILTAVVFLVMAVVPTISLAELGVRGAVAVFVFGFYDRSGSDITQSSVLPVTLAFSLLWIINLAIPALLGGFGLLQLRFFRNGS